jgi:3-deoxy-D-manno-octulosonic acid (KDO) 8-phosphate synthase
MDAKHSVSVPGPFNGSIGQKRFHIPTIAPAAVGTDGLFMDTMYE